MQIATTQEIPGESLPVARKVNVYINQTLGEQIYRSCKSVKYRGMNDNAMDMIKGGTTNYLDMLNFMGEPHDSSLSPLIFRFLAPETISEEEGVQRLFIESKTCNETGPFRCQCFDCEESCDYLNNSSSSDIEVQSSSHKIWSMNYWSIAIYGIWILCLVYISMGYYKRRYRREYQEIPQSTDLYNETVVEEDIRPLHWIVDRFVSRTIAYSAQTCSQHPITVILLTFIVALISSYGWLGTSIETHPMNLWVGGRVSSIQRQKEIFETNFGPLYRTEQIIFTETKNSDNSILSRNHIESVFLLEDILQTFSVQDDCGKNITLNDLCYKPLGTSCLIQSVTAYWQHSLEKFKQDKQWLSHLEMCARNPISSMGCLPDEGVPIKPETVLGGFNHTDYMNSHALFTTLFLENHKDLLLQRRARLWEKSLSQYLHHVSFPGMNMSFITEVRMRRIIYMCMCVLR
jgi:Niemann-Pick C1 protein